MTTLPVTLRPAADADAGFVLNSWLKSYRASMTVVPSSQYFSRFGHRGLVMDLMGRQPIVVASWDEDPAVIVGWSCGEPSKLLHYVYVKQAFRRQGIGTRLVAALDLAGEGPLRCTHGTDAFIMGPAKGRTIRIVDPYLEAQAA